MDFCNIPLSGGRINEKTTLGKTLLLFYYMIFYINNTYNVLIQGGSILEYESKISTPTLCLEVKCLSLGNM